MISFLESVFLTVAICALSVMSVRSEEQLESG